MQTGQFPSAHSAVRQILAKEGVRGLYAVYYLPLYLSFEGFKYSYLLKYFSLFVCIARKNVY